MMGEAAGCCSRGARAAITRKGIIGIARSWIGTPYHHQASAKGVGTDCLGLLRGICREVYGREPQKVPHYPYDWSTKKSDEALLTAASCHFDTLAFEQMGGGDILIFRLRRGAAAQHLGIAVEGNRLIHAVERYGCVEVPLSEAWRRRMSAVFAFRGIK